MLSLVTSEFLCPELASLCTCGMGSGWVNQTWRTDLTVVNCSSRGLTDIPDLSSLQGQTVHQLLLENNNITDISARDFFNVSFKEIVLSKNPIRRIDNEAFTGLRDDLEKLDLHNDKIVIDKGLPFLKGLHQLTTLDLGYNEIEDKIKNLPNGLFKDLGLSSLTSLSLQALRMENLVVGTFLGIEGIEQLDLSYNLLFEFPKEVLTLKNLQGLKLYHNEILRLRNNTFSGLTRLKKLLIGINDIETIEVGAFIDLEDSLEELNLYYNPLYSVPTEALENLRNLKKLSLVRTSLEYVTNGSFVGMYALEELHLDNNPKLSFVDGMFHGIEDSLKVLFIRELNLEHLPLQALGNLENLQYIDATYNEIKRIDKNFFKGLGSLNTAILMWNSIKHVDHRAFQHFSKGVTLNLYKNQIHNISFLLDVEPCTFKEVVLTHNKIKCDCELERVLNSGMFSWGVLGDCHTDKLHGHKRWYSFSDPALMDHLHETCPKTTPFSSCVQRASYASKANNGASVSVSLVVMLIVICLVFRG